MRTLSILVLGGSMLLAGQAIPSYAQSGDQPGSSSTGVGGGQEMNQPKGGSIDKRSIDMTAGKTGIPSHYDVVPVRRGELKDEKGGMLNHEVTNQQGEKLGTIEKLLKDTKTGKIEYAILELADTKFQLPLQWSLFKQQGDKLTLKATKKDLENPVNSSMAKDNSPEISHYMEEINKVREAPKAGGSGGLGVTDRPAAGGSQGEDQAGGAGPSGPRAMPPQGQAPGHEEGSPSSKH